MSTCPNCGTEATSKFCPECGTAVPTTEEFSTSVGDESTTAGTSTSDSPANSGPNAAAGSGSSSLQPKPLLAGIGGIALLALVAFFVIGRGSDETIYGLFGLTALEGAEGEWDSCSGDGGYSDLDAGVPVRIENQDGKRIGAATLRNLTRDDLEVIAELERDGARSGLLLTDIEDMEEDERSVEGIADSYEAGLSLGEALGWCYWFWEAEGVEKADIYNFDIGRRGDIDVTRAELVEDKMLVTFGID